MKKVSKFFKNLPIEALVLGIPAISLIVISLYLQWKLNIFSETFVTDVVLALSGNAYLDKGLFILYIYILFRWAGISIKQILNNPSAKEIILIFLRTFKSLFFWMLIIALSSFALGNSLSILFQMKSPSDIAIASYRLLHADLFIFQTYPSNAINLFFTHQPLLGKIAMWSYGNLASIISIITLLTLLFFNTKILRRFLISFFLVSFIGLIFWYLIPATSPRGYIDLNITKTDNSLVAKYKATPSITVLEKLPETDKIWLDPKGKSFNISTFPSMHAAWALIAVLSLILISRYFAIILVPWFIMLSLGAVGIYQHYAVDIFLGGTLSAGVFWLSGKFLEWEEKYFNDKYKLLIMLHVIENDGKMLLKKFRK